jgi:hypothetical protein
MAKWLSKFLAQGQWTGYTETGLTWKDRLSKPVLLGKIQHLWLIKLERFGCMLAPGSWANYNHWQSVSWANYRSRANSTRLAEQRWGPNFMSGWGKPEALGKFSTGGWSNRPNLCQLSKLLPMSIPCWANYWCGANYTRDWRLLADPTWQICVVGYPLLKRAGVLDWMSKD